MSASGMSPRGKPGHAAASSGRRPVVMTAMAGVTAGVVAAAMVGSDVIARPPATIGKTGGLIVLPRKTAIIPIPAAATRNDATGRGKAGDAHDQPAAPENNGHFVTSLLSLSGHSSRPNTAPAGSATTATMLP